MIPFRLGDIVLTTPISGVQLCAGTRRFGLGGKACMASRVMQEDAGKAGDTSKY